jgi:OOP family OmpA-OmpF porin
MHTTTSNLIALLLAFSIAPMTAAASDGFYAAASIGSASLDDDFDGLEISDNTTAYRIATGWQVNRYFALEVGYHNFGDFEQSFTFDGVRGTAKLSADGYTLGVNGRYPLWNKVDLLGRAGGFFWDGEADINNASQATPEDSNLFFGLGLSYDLSDRFAVTTEWTRYELKSTTSDVYSVGLQFRFGR